MRTFGCCDAGDGWNEASALCLPFVECSALAAEGSPVFAFAACLALGLGLAIGEAGFAAMLTCAGLAAVVCELAAAAFAATMWASPVARAAGWLFCCATDVGLVLVTPADVELA